MCGAVQLGQVLVQYKDLRATLESLVQQVLRVFKVPLELPVQQVLKVLPATTAPLVQLESLVQQALKVLRAILELPDLKGPLVQPDLVVAVVLVHQRFTTQSRDIKLLPMEQQ